MQVEIFGWHIRCERIDFDMLTGERFFGQSNASYADIDAGTEIHEGRVPLVCSPLVIGRVPMWAGNQIGQTVLCHNERNPFSRKTGRRGRGRGNCSRAYASRYVANSAAYQAQSAPRSKRDPPRGHGTPVVRTCPQDNKPTGDSMYEGGGHSSQTRSD